MDWYAIQTYSGSEQSVKKAIENLANDHNIRDRIQEIIVPTEDIIEVSKKSKTKVTERSLYPGYVFIKVDLDTVLWHKIQSLPRVSRFIGENKKPTPLSEADIGHILEKMNNRAAPKPKIFLSKAKWCVWWKALLQTLPLRWKSMMWSTASSSSMFLFLVGTLQ